MAKINILKNKDITSTDFTLEKYKFKSIDNAFEQYGNIKVTVQFTYDSGILACTGTFEDDIGEYSIWILIDGKEKKLKITLPTLFYNYLVDDFIDFDLPNLTVDQKYTLLIYFLIDSVKIQIIDSDQKILFDKETNIGLLSYIGEERLKNMSFKFGTNTLFIDETEMYYNIKDQLEEDFLYVGNRIFDDDYIGVISLDNSTEILTKNEILRNALNIKLLEGEFVYQDSDYRQVFGIVNNRNTGAHEYISISIDDSKLKDKNEKYLINDFYILVPFKKTEDDSSVASRAYNFSNLWINGTHRYINLSKNYSSFWLIKYDITNQKIIGKYLNLDNTFNKSILGYTFKDLFSQSMKSNDLNTIMFGKESSYSYNKFSLYYRGIYFFHNNPEKYLLKSAMNMKLPLVDSNTYLIDNEIVDIQV